MVGFFARWPDGAPSQTIATPTLNDVTMEVNQGELVMVVGNVGSGKSSLISAFMGSMARVRGRTCIYTCVRWYQGGGG